MLVEARNPAVLFDHARQRTRAADALDDRLEVRRGGAAASANQAQAELLDELLVGGGEFVWGERIARAVGPEHRQSGVGHAHHRDVRELREVAQVLAHLGGPGCAVEADHVDSERLERGQGRCDLAAHEHRARGLNRHLDEDRQADARLDDGLLAAVDRGLGLEQVLRGLDQQSVRPPRMSPFACSAKVALRFA